MARTSRLFPRRVAIAALMLVISFVLLFGINALQRWSHHIRVAT